jgi:hypothetical protein
MLSSPCISKPPFDRSISDKACRDRNKEMSVVHKHGTHGSMVGSVAYLELECAGFFHCLHIGCAQKAHMMVKQHHGDDASNGARTRLHHSQ